MIVLVYLLYTMDYIYSIIFAAVQAITEFLPISSTGHLIILHQLLKSDLLDSLAFDVMLHFGTLAALVIYFWKDILSMVKEIFCPKKTSEPKLAYLILVGIIPALAVGYFLENIIEQKFRSVGLVAVSLVVGGILFVIAEKYGKKNRELVSLTYRNAFVIGWWQALALVPGISRSGISIVGGLLAGLNRRSSAKFSFLMSMPVILIAGIKSITQISLSDASLDLIFVFIFGAATAALFGYFAIKFLMRFLENNSLVPFAVYRFILAAVIIIFLFKL